MNRPYVICHMLVSLDGKIDGAFMSASDNLPFRKSVPTVHFPNFGIFIHFLIFRAIWTTVFKIFPTEYWKNLGWELEKGYPFDWTAFLI